MFLRRLIGEGERVLALVSYGCTTKALLIIYITDFKKRAFSPFVQVDRLIEIMSFWHMLPVTQFVVYDSI